MHHPFVFAMPRLSWPRRQRSLHFALIYCRYILDKLSHPKGFAASNQQDIIFLTEPWLSEDTPNWLTTVEGYQSFIGNGNDRRGGDCFVYPRQSLLTYVLTHSTFEVTQESVSPTVKVSSRGVHMVFIYGHPLPIEMRLLLLGDAFACRASFPSKSKS